MKLRLLINNPATPATSDKISTTKVQKITLPFDGVFDSIFFVNFDFSIALNCLKNMRLVTFSTSAEMIRWTQL